MGMHASNLSLAIPLLIGYLIFLALCTIMSIVNLRRFFIKKQGRGREMAGFLLWSIPTVVLWMPVLLVLFRIITGYGTK